MQQPPHPGDIVLLDSNASVQFAGTRSCRLMVAAFDRRPTYQGWIWLRGYVLDRAGLATGQREVFVLLAGLRQVSP